jgi:tetratricopeptide (TPR) repeat protein
VLVETRYYPPSRGLFSVRTWSFLLTGFVFLVFAGVLFATGPASSAIALGLAVSCFIAHGVSFRLRSRRLASLATRNEQALALLGGGRLQEAARVFDSLVDASSRYPDNHSIFVMNRALVHLQEGDLDESSALLSMLAAMNTFDKSGYAEPRFQLFKSLSLVEALRGELASAAVWLTRAAQTISPRRRSLLLDLEAIIEARRGSYAAAAAKIEAGWQEAEGVLPLQGIKLLALLHGFALEAADVKAGRNDEVERLVAMARSLPPGSYRFLATRWEELHAFCLRHGLDGVAGAPLTHVMRTLN